MKKMMRTAAVLAAMVLSLSFFSCSNSAGDDRGNRAESEDNKNPSGGGLGGVTDDGSGDKTGVDKIPEGGGDSPAEIPFETGKYFTAKGVSDGIKITISSALKFRENGGSYISVDGVPFIINITNDDLINMSGVKEYVFPFTKNNEVYNVTVHGGTVWDTWVSETVKCVAGGGIDYTEYVNVAPIENSKLTISYEEPDGNGKFGVTLELDTSKYGSVIKDSSLFEKFSFHVTVLLGKNDWSNTGWLDDNEVDILTSSSDFFAFGFLKTLDQDNWREKYNYEYGATMDTIIKLNDYPAIEFAIPRVLSEQMRYEPKSGN